MSFREAGHGYDFGGQFAEPQTLEEFFSQVGTAHVSEFGRLALALSQLAVGDLLNVFARLDQQSKETFYNLMPAQLRAMAMQGLAPTNKSEQFNVYVA